MQQVSFGILLSKNWFRNPERVRDTNSTRGEIVCQGAPLPPDVASVCGRHNPLSLSLLLHCSKYSSNSNPRRLPWQLCNEHRAPCRLQSSSPVDGRAADAVLPPSCVVVVAVVVAAFYSLHSKTTAARLSSLQVHRTQGLMLYLSNSSITSIQSLGLSRL